RAGPERGASRNAPARDTGRSRPAATFAGAAEMRPALRSSLGWAAVLALGLLLPRALLADTKDTRTIKDLESRPVQVKKDTKLDANATKAMDNYRHFLELQHTDPQLRAEAMRRLGDLNLDAGELERMEKEVNAIDIQGAEAIRLY